MEDLPINGRNWQDLGMLALGSRVNGVGTNEIAAEGAGTYQVNVDGQQVTYWGGGLGNVQPRFSRDAIAEFEFIANRFDATQGRSQGIQINAVTKGGTNNYLGTFGGYFRDDSLNAADKISRSSRVTTSTGRTSIAWTCGSHGASPSTADSRSNRSSRCSTFSTGPTSTSGT
jgi:hypothetical protein